MTFVSASWGFDPQTVGGHEIVGDGVPERLGLRLDETANWKKTEAVVLAVCVDPLDALAQSIDSLARFARHAFPPRLETDGLLLSLADTPRERGRLDVVPFAGSGRTTRTSAIADSPPHISDRESQPKRKRQFLHTLASGNDTTPDVRFLGIALF
jgi:hypothetical protein